RQRGGDHRVRGGRGGRHPRRVRRVPGGPRLPAGGDPVGRAGLREHSRRPARLRAPVLSARARAAVTVEAVERARRAAALGRTEEALATVDEVLAASPDQLDALLLKSRLLREGRRDEEALAVSRRAAAVP